MCGPMIIFLFITYCYDICFEADLILAVGFFHKGKDEGLLRTDYSE